MFTLCHRMFRRSKGKFLSILKAYKGPNNTIRTFRLNCNMFRMKHSAKRLSLPDFDGVELEKCID